jgi:hypothetical protein
LSLGREQQLGGKFTIAASSRCATARQSDGRQLPARSPGHLRGGQAGAYSARDRPRGGPLDEQCGSGGVPVPAAARIERRSALRHRPKVAARSSAAKKVSWECTAANVLSLPSSDPWRVSLAAAAPARDTSAEAPRPQNCFFARVLVTRPRSRWYQRRLAKNS